MMVHAYTCSNVAALKEVLLTSCAKLDGTVVRSSCYSVNIRLKESQTMVILKCNYCNRLTIDIRI